MFLIKSSWIYFFNWTHFLQNFSGRQARYWVLNKDRTVWLEGGRPSCTVSHPIPGEYACTGTWHTHTQKYICKYKKYKIQSNNFFYLKNQRNSLTNSLLSTLRSPNVKLDIFQLSYKLSIYENNYFILLAPTIRQPNIRWSREYKRGKYHCTIDLLFDWFGISCMTTDNFCFYLQNRLFQTSRTGGQQYSDSSIR